METPAEIVSQYTPRTMIPALVQAPRPNTFMLDRLVKRTTEETSDIIEIDVEKGGETVAAYVSPSGSPNIVGKAGYVSNIHAIPYVYESIPFTAKDLDIRLPGETVYQGGGKGPKARLDTKMGKWLARLGDRFIRLEEKQLCEALQTGKLVVQGKDVDFTIDFKMNANHIIVNSGDDLWDDALSKKLKQMETACQLVRDAGAPSITDCYMGVDAAEEFLDDASIQASLDNRRIKLGEIDFKQMADQRATYIGTVNRIGMQIDVWSYQGKYRNAAGSMVSFLDPKKIVMVSNSVRVERHYGMIRNLHHGSFVGKQFPDVIIDPRGRNGELTLESGPLVALHQPDAVVVITVLV